MVKKSYNSDRRKFLQGAAGLTTIIGGMKALNSTINKNNSENNWLSEEEFRQEYNNGWNSADFRVYDPEDLVEKNSVPKPDLFYTNLSGRYDSVDYGGISSSVLPTSKLSEKGEWDIVWDEDRNVPKIETELGLMEVEKALSPDAIGTYSAELLTVVEPDSDMSMPSITHEIDRTKYNPDFNRYTSQEIDPFEMGKQDFQGQAAIVDMPVFRWTEWNGEIEGELSNGESYVMKVTDFDEVNQDFDSIEPSNNREVNAYAEFDTNKMGVSSHLEPFEFLRLSNHEVLHLEYPNITHSNSDVHGNHFDEGKPVQRGNVDDKWWRENELTKRKPQAYEIFEKVSKEKGFIKSTGVIKHDDGTYQTRSEDKVLKNEEYEEIYDALEELIQEKPSSYE